MTRVAVVIVAGLLGMSAAAAQTTSASDAKPETACTTSSAATTGSGEEKTANSMSVEKSAVLPEAGGSNSAAPTVQSGGKPLKVDSELPAGFQTEVISHGPANPAGRSVTPRPAPFRAPLRAA